MVLVSGKVITVDPAGTVAQALAVKDGLIQAVGNDETIGALVGEETKVIDVGGKALTPGLIDPHNHLQVWGQLQGFYVALMPPEVKTMDDLRKKLAEAVAQTPEGEWVRGYFLSVGERLPNRHDLDPVLPHHPVWIMQQGGHYGSANSLALQIAGITADTPDPAGGVIEREASGEPSGVFYNRRAMDTNGEHPGTDLGDLMGGLNAYLAAKGLDEDYTLTLRRSPSYDWVREEVRQNQQVLLLLGFWELQPGGWRRLGGHYVGVAGAGCGDEDWIAISDPFRNYAEAGWPGRMVPAESHGHAPDPPHVVHNDVAYVSHDVYGIVRTASGWGPQGYARRYADIANFAGLNFAPALEAARATAYLNGDILTLADYALALTPRSEAVTLRVLPAINRVHVGEQFLVEMEVRAGVQDVDAVNAYLDFDPAVLTVVDEEGNPATQVIAGVALPTVTTNSVNNTTGRINFVASGDSVNGRFQVATVRFKAITTTLASQLAFSLEAPRASDVRLAGESVLDHLRDGRVTVRQGAFVVGQATMQGRPTPPDASWSVPLMLTLSRAGEQGPAYAYSTVSSQNGAFSMPGVVAPGNYWLRLKGLHTLRNLLPTTLNSGANTADVETLLEGDAINDNRVDVRDVSAVAAAYGKSQGQTGFDPRADFNEDDTINDADVNLLQANLGRRGDILLGPHVSRLALREMAPETFDLELATSPQAGAVSLRLVPTSTTAAMGDVIVLEVVADAGVQEVDAAELHLDFDPAVLQVVDAAGHPATGIEPGTALPTVLLNSVDPARGWADYMASSLGSSPISGEFIVARLRFKVLQGGKTWVRFSFSDWRPTDVTYQAQSVLGSVDAAEVEAMARYNIYLPVILKQ